MGNVIKSYICLIKLKLIYDMITLQQDANEKLSVTLNEETILIKARKFFKWRKNITIQRIYSLGTAQRDKFIKSLSN